MLAGDGFVLRPLRESDFPLFVAASQSDVPDWPFVPRDLDEASARPWVAERAAASAAGGPIRLVIEVGGAAAGMVGAHQPNAHDPGVLEAFYFVLPDFRRRGLASAALRLLGEHARSTRPGVRRLQLWIIEGNPGSGRVAEAAGYVHEGVARSQIAPVNGFGPRDAALWGRVIG